MKARETILGKIRALRLAEVPEPEIPLIETAEADELMFRRALEAAGAEIVDIEEAEVSVFLKRAYPKGSIITAGDLSVEGIKSLSELRNSIESETLTIGVIHAEFGVSENGALWISRDCLANPVFPFIAEHLVVLIKKGNICSNMHSAYEKISLRDAPFGLFIAGPSKTADIEQSLVIGAHGPLSLTVVITS